jgi:hypothetical protein
MSYDLFLFFEPAIPRRRMLEYFGARKHYTIDGDHLAYGNPHTEVYFSIRFRHRRNALLQSVVAAARFEINYARPSFFGLEAEKELSAFAAAFQPRIEDPQTHGMADGPYSGQGFLNGWNFCNVLCIGSFMSHHVDFAPASMPAETLRAVWAWNYDCAARRDRFAQSAFVPVIRFDAIEGRPSRTVVWPLGMPIILPRVDYVLLGRDVANEKRCGLAPWPEVEDVVRRAGFDVTKDPLDLHYFLTPTPIADWFANFPLIDPTALRSLPAYQILDDELISAARERPNKD